MEMAAKLSESKKGDGEKTPDLKSGARAASSGLRAEAKRSLFEDGSQATETPRKRLAVSLLIFIFCLLLYLSFFFQRQFLRVATTEDTDQEKLPDNIAKIKADQIPK